MKLIEIQRLNSEINNIQEAIENVKPKIFWKDKPIILQQLKKWSLESLLKISGDLAKVEVLMKKKL